MADSILSHNDFMQQLDLEDMQIDGEEEYSLPSGHVLNIAFFMEPDSEDGQGYTGRSRPSQRSASYQNTIQVYALPPLLRRQKTRSKRQRLRS